MQDATHQVPSLAPTADTSIAVALSSAQNVPLLLLTPLVNPKRPLLLLPLLPVLLRGVLKVAVAAAAAAVGSSRRRREGGGRGEGERRRRREGKVRRQGQGRSEKKCWMFIFRIVLSFFFTYVPAATVLLFSVVVVGLVVVAGGGGGGGRVLHVAVVELLEQRELVSGSKGVHAWFDTKVLKPNK